MTPEEFEKKTGLTGWQAMRLLCVSKSKYYEWRRGVRTIPHYIVASMEAHAKLARDQLESLIASRKGQPPEA